MDNRVGANDGRPSGDAGWEGNQDQFRQDVLAGSDIVPVVAVFWSPHSAKSAQVIPTFDAALLSAGDGVRLVTINIDQNGQLTDLLTPFGLSTQDVPIVIVYWRGRPWKVIQGTPTEANFERLLAEVTQQAHSQVLEQGAMQLPLQERRFGVRISPITDRNLLRSASFVLAARADLPPENVRRLLPASLKIGPVEQIAQLVNVALPGIGLTPLPVAPPQLPSIANTAYFEFDRSSQHFADLANSGGIAIHVSGEWPGLALELWAIRTQLRQTVGGEERVIASNAAKQQTNRSGQLASQDNVCIIEFNKFLDHIPLLETAEKNEAAKVEAEAKEKAAAIAEKLFYNKTNLIEQQINQIARRKIEINNSPSSPKGLHEIAQYNSRTVTAILAGLGISILLFLIILIWISFRSFLAPLLLSVALGVASFLILISWRNSYFGSKRENEMKDLDDQLRLAEFNLGAAKRELDKEKLRLSNNKRRVLDETSRFLEKSRADALANWEKMERSLRSEAKNRFGALGVLGAPYAAREWTDWAAGTDAPGTVRIGELVASTAPAAAFLKCPIDRIALPATVPVPGPRGLLLSAGSSVARTQALQALQSLAFRLLATIPPGRARFTLIDPVGLGQNVAPLLKLGDHEEELIGARAWSETLHIEKELSEITQHMENVIQKYLRTEYKTIDDYNRAAGRIAEPYRILAVADFPANFSEGAIRRLISIAENGPRCGVFPLVVFDRNRELPHGINAEEISRRFVEVASGQDKKWHFPDLPWWEVVLDDAPPAALVEKVISTVGPLASEGMKVSVPYSELLAFAGVGTVEQCWRPDRTTIDEFRIPLGPRDARSYQDLVFGRGTAHHGLLIGQTGSGKSNLLHALITTAALVYSPTELQLYLIDFKLGVEFTLYAQAELPQARVIAIQSEREFGLAVLRELMQELGRRGDLCRAHGSSLSNYRRRTGAPMPRILLIVDEFRVFFEANDRIATEATMILDRLVSQGRSFGIHVLLASQTLAGEYSLPRSIADQMGVRILLQCSEADSRLALAADNPAGRLLSRPGEAIYNDAQGLIEGNHRFQVADMGNDDQREALVRERLLPLTQKLGAERPRPVVFEGHVPAKIEDCGPLRDLLSNAQWPAPKPFADVWLGEPLTLDPPTSIRFSRQGGANALFVLRDEDCALSLLHASLIALAAQMPGDRGARFRIVDVSSADGHWPDRTAALAAKLPGVSVTKSRGLLPTLEEVGKIVENRTASEIGTEAPVFLVLIGAHRMRELRDDDAGFSSYSSLETDPPQTLSARQRLSSILRDGPEVGVHVLVWADALNGLERAMDRRMLSDIALRVVGPMSEQDSQTLLDDPAAARIVRPHRLIRFDEDKPGSLVQFRPYLLDKEDWAIAAARRLAARGEA